MIQHAEQRRLGNRISVFSSIINRLGLGPRACRMGLHAWQYGATIDYDDGELGPVLIVTDYTWCSRDGCPTAAKPSVVGGDWRRVPKREETTHE